MPDTSEFSRNRAALDRCNRIYKWIFVFLAAFIIAAVIYTFYQGIVFLLAARIADLIALLFAGIVFTPLSIGMMIYSGYRRIDMFAYFSPLVSLAGFLFGYIMGADVSYLAFPLIAVLAAVIPTVLTNARYRYLEEQEGFPHFSALLMEQLQRSDDFKANNPFEAAAKRYKMTESDSMNDLETNGDAIQEKVNEKINYMDEI